MTKDQAAQKGRDSHSKPRADQDNNDKPSKWSKVDVGPVVAIGLLGAVFTFFLIRVGIDSTRATAATLASILLARGGVALVRKGGKGYNDEVDTERERLKFIANLAATPPPSEDELLARHRALAAVSGSVLSSLPQSDTQIESQRKVAAEPPVESKLQDVRFTNLLIEYYAHGLVEARSSSTNSRRSSWLGMIVIVIGVFLAILSGVTDILGKGVQISLIVSGSGVITNAIGILFHRQANKALAHMENQTASLQNDMWSDQDRRVAIDLIGRISTQSLRDQLLAGIVLQLSHAKIPENQESEKLVDHDPVN